MPEHVRAYIYRLGTPVAALLMFYGVIGETEASLWLGLLGAALMVGEGAIASMNTSTKRIKKDQRQLK